MAISFSRVKHKLLAASFKSLQLINRTELSLQLTSPLSSSKEIISGFSGGITTKSVIHNYKYNEAQFLVKTGNSLNIGLNQLRSNTSENVIGSGIRQQKSSPALNFAHGILINTLQQRLPQAMLSKGETVTLLLTLFHLLTLMRRSFYRQILAGIGMVQFTQQVQTQQYVPLPLAPNGVRVYLVPLENKSKFLTLHLVESMMKYNRNVMLSIVTSAAKWVAAVLHKVLGVVPGPLGAINPIADMIARGVGCTTKKANKFLNR
ncbi:MAG: hypothetical protein EZS28_027189 [Streblomastix strix]|uniref:Uncharacterized protein n=1 Tax=Streblomastix strix TaxID=222440 RepID=A0A5J4V4I3_9EUKA|nr:MAG: hypothetical protein EZS28_027189 [Streblomastix strix]